MVGHFPKGPFYLQENQEGRQCGTPLVSMNTARVHLEKAHDALKVRVIRLRQFGNRFHANKSGHSVSRL